MGLEALERPRVEAVEEILGKPFPVLDDGFVRVVDYMGSDASIVQAARVSYGKGTKKIHQDRGLIRYLMRHRHTTPFEMCEIKFHIRVPMDCWRQWVRHRTANINEYSTRYSIAIDAAQTTKPEEWRLQAGGNRQGSAGFLDPELGADASRKEAALHKLCRETYEERLEMGIAREQARKDLPLCTYTEAYWKIDLHNLFHFLSLRMAENAQYEIRCYAKIIGYEIVSRWCPLAWEAFLDYQVHSQILTRIEIGIIREILSGHIDKALKLAVQDKLLPEDYTPEMADLKKNREREEFEAKLKLLNIPIPWRS